MKNRWIFALCMAVMWGIIFANALHDVVTGVCMGLLMEMAFGLLDCTKETEDAEETNAAIVNGEGA